MTELLKVIVWPVTIVFLVFKLRDPLTALITAIGQRATRFKILQFEIELGALVPASPSLAMSAEALQQAVVQASGTTFIVQGITKSAAADYVLVALGDDDQHAWLSSRLFLLSVLIDRNRVVRCIVFTGEHGGFIGAASPRDVRAALGARFPEYERALLAAYGIASTLPLDELRNGDLSEAALTRIATGFLSNSGITQINEPASPHSGWLYLDRSSKPGTPSTWELAEHITAGGLRTLLGDGLGKGRVVGAAGTVPDPDTARAIINQPGVFVALVSSSGEFRELCDRTAIADRLSRSVAHAVS
ncbi:hypothetical protein [Caballeronia cordobensis]|uniref:hypothetical protein n=1 Tax=Caballeronia cordobensis TaxID=1353886 RepID=UPI00045EE4C7|nr:putative membrane protein [Burkholderia sp. RPE67]